MTLHRIFISLLLLVSLPILLPLTLSLLLITASTFNWFWPYSWLLLEVTIILFTTLHFLKFQKPQSYLRTILVNLLLTSLINIIITYSSNLNPTIYTILLILSTLIVLLKTLTIPYIYFLPFFKSSLLGGGPLAYYYNIHVKPLIFAHIFSYPLAFSLTILIPATANLLKICIQSISGAKKNHPQNLYSPSTLLLNNLRLLEIICWITIPTLIIILSCNIANLVIKLSFTASTVGLECRIKIIQLWAFLHKSILIFPIRVRDHDMLTLITTSWI